MFNLFQKIIDTILAIARIIEFAEFLTSTIEAPRGKVKINAYDVTATVLVMLVFALDVISLIAVLITVL